MCVEIIGYNVDVALSDQLELEYSFQGYTSKENEWIVFGDSWGNLNPTSCRSASLDAQYFDITISQDENRTSTKRIELAEHNYCGEDIAYVIATLHEDSPPTFGDTFYVSPCKNRGL